MHSKPDLADTDGDGLWDSDEYFIYDGSIISGSDPFQPDTDDDGIDDYYDDEPLRYNAPGTVYNRQAAVEYAVTWGDGVDTDVKCYNEEFFIPIKEENGGNANETGPDCANFVSQCVLSGNVKMNSEWYMIHPNNWYSDYAFIDSNIKEIISNIDSGVKNDWHSENGWVWSLSWGYDVDQYDYFKKYKKKKNTTISITYDSFDKDMISAFDEGIRPGDIMYFIDSSGLPGHVVFITEVNTHKGYIKYAGHTNHTSGTILTSELIKDNGSSVEIISLDEVQLCL